MIEKKALIIKLVVDFFITGLVICVLAEAMGINLITSVSCIVARLISVALWECGNRSIVKNGVTSIVISLIITHCGFALFF